MNEQIAFSWSGTSASGAVDFETFRPYCNKQQAFLSFGEDQPRVAACSFKNERPAQSWDDWQPCNEDNCPFMRQVRGLNDKVC